MTPFQMALAHLSRKKAQSVMLLLSLAISIAAGGLLLRIYTLTQARFETIARGGEVVVGAKAGGIDILLGSHNLEAENPGFLPVNLFNSLRSGQVVKFEDGAEVNTASFVSSVIPILYVAKIDSTKVIATDLSFFNRPRTADSLELKEGKYFSDLIGDEVVLGSRAATETGAKIGDQVRLTMISKDDAKDFMVVGILKSTGTAWDRGSYISLKSAYKWFDEKSSNHSQNLSMTHSIWKNNVLNYFLIYMKPEGFKPLQSLINDRTVGQMINVHDELAKLSQLTGSGGELGLVIVSFIILLSSLSVAGMMMIRYEGMRFQAAVLRAMGFPIIYMFKWLVSEGLIVALGGCLVGALIDISLFPAMVALLGKAVPQSDVISPSILWSLPVWFMAILATLVGILIPFRRLYKLDVHSILKGF